MQSAHDLQQMGIGHELFSMILSGKLRSLLCSDRSTANVGLSSRAIKAFPKKMYAV